jgi:hypothetical protein
MHGVHCLHLTQLWNSCVNCGEITKGLRLKLWSLHDLKPKPHESLQKVYAWMHRLIMVTQGDTRCHKNLSSLVLVWDFKQGT